MSDQTHLTTEKRPLDAPPPLRRYSMVAQTVCGEAWQDLEPDEEYGDWVPYEDLVLFLRFWGGYIQGHREMLESMKLHPKIVEAVRKAEKAFNEFGNE